MKTDEARKLIGKKVKVRTFLGSYVGEVVSVSRGRITVRAPSAMCRDGFTDVSYSLRDKWKDRITEVES